MNIINSTPRRAPKSISATERAMKLEQKPKCSSRADESSYHGPEHTRLCHSIHTKFLQRQPYMYDCHIKFYAQIKKNIISLTVLVMELEQDQNVAHNLTRKIFQTISILKTWRALL